MIIAIYEYTCLLVFIFVFIGGLKDHFEPVINDSTPKYSDIQRVNHMPSTGNLLQRFNCTKNHNPSLGSLGITLPSVLSLDSIWP